METHNLNSETEQALTRALGTFESFNSAALETAVLSAIMRNRDALNGRPTPSNAVQFS